MRADDYQSTTKAEAYGNQRFSGGRNKVSEDELTLIKSWIHSSAEPKNAVFLDLGAGTGRITGELLSYHPQKVHALDNSTYMLDYLKSKLKKPLQQKTLQTVNSSSDKIPLGNGSVDIVTSLHLFKHLNNPNATISEVKRVLKNNGYFIFDVLNKNSLIHLRKGTCIVTSEEEIRRVLSKNGFEIRDIVYLHSFGETAYGFLGKIGGNLLYILDRILQKGNIKTGTKIFVLAQKR